MQLHNVVLNLVSQHLHYYIEKRDANIWSQKAPKWSTMDSRFVIILCALASFLVFLYFFVQIEHRLGFWKVEELQKFAFPSSECVLGGLLPDEDYERFSSPDHYWCFPFERAVNKNIEQSSKKKNIEHTFARADSRSEFLNLIARNW